MSFIGNVVERAPSSSNTNTTTSHFKVSSTGFPAVKHRSASRFSKSHNRPLPPKVAPTRPSNEESGDDWRREMELQNSSTVASLSPEERETEIQDVKDQLGPGIEDMLRRVREAREKRQAEDIKRLSLPTGEAGEDLPPLESRPALSIRHTEQPRFTGKEPSFTNDDEELPPPLEPPVQNPGKQSSFTNPEKSPSAIVNDFPRPIKPALQFSALSDGHTERSWLANRQLPSSTSHDEELSPLLTAAVQAPVPVLFPSPRSTSQTQPKTILRNVSSSHSQPERPSSTPPSSARRLRFVDPTPNDIHVYESAPSSPRRVIGFLPPPDPNDPAEPLLPFRLKSSGLHPPSGNSNSDTKASPTIPKPREAEDEMEEGTPAHIHSTFFPTETLHNPSLEWLLPSSPPSSSNGDKNNSIRYSLSGTPIPTNISTTLPTHLGLHHHADPSQRAGYTLSDLLHLSRSSVTSQRAMMLTVLSKVLLLKERDNKLPKKDMSKIMAVGVEAIGFKKGGGGLGVCCAGVEVLLAALMYLEQDEEGAQEIVKDLPTEGLLSLIEDHLKENVLPLESQRQLLQIIYRLIVITSIAIDTTTIADQVLGTPGLLGSIERRFLPFLPSSDEGEIEDEKEGVGEEDGLLALSFFSLLARASRKTASQLVAHGESFLRFLAMDFSSSPKQKWIKILNQALKFYNTLAQYGLGTQVASVGRELFTKLERHLVSSSSASNEQSLLVTNYLSLLETWFVCATNPHRTTPKHDLVWSQVSGWDWGKTALSLATSSSSSTTITTAAYHAVAAWLEGCIINSPKRGEKERQLVRGSLWEVLCRTVVEDDKEKVVAGMRLALAVIDSPIGRVGGEDEMVSLCFDSALEKRLLQRMEDILSPSRPVILSLDSELCYHVLRYTLGHPNLSPEQWLKFASILLTFLPQNQHSIAEWLFFRLPRIIPLCHSLLLTSATEQTFLNILPLLVTSLRSLPLTYTPSHPSVEYLDRLTSCHPLPEEITQLNPELWSLKWPLDHLFHSETSDVFQRNSPHDLSNVSETEIVKASLLLTVIMTPDKGASREEMIFQCMRIFMLEHDQPASSGPGGEGEDVFRDLDVEKLMHRLLEPFRYSSSPSPREIEGIRTVTTTQTLEDVAKRTLGSQTPFYQFYTDFVSLYDSISFFQPLFGTLLLPPLSSAYPSDYIHLLFGDYPHLLHTIKTSIEDVLMDNLRGYLYPMKKDPRTIGGCLRALEGGKLKGFMRFFILHRVASNIWPDLGGADDGERRLLIAVMERCKVDEVRDIVRYVQRREGEEGEVLLPPDCFGDEEIVESRLKEVGEWDENLTEKLAKIVRP